MRLRMLLNTGFSGPQAWLLLALRRGYVADAGIELELTPGSGAYNAAPRLMAEGFDLAHGDINAAVELAARGEAAPVGVCATFRASPSCIAVPAESNIDAPRDLAGKRLIGHASDVALRSFGAFCTATGLALGDVLVEAAEGPMATLARHVLRGEADGLFCYVSTLHAALGDGIAAFRCFRYADLVPELYGSAIMATPSLARDAPDALRGLLRAVNRGMGEALAEPEAAMDAVQSFAPGADRAAERRRWETTLAIEMAPHDADDRFGGVDVARFARAVALHARGLGLPAPDAETLFSDAFLPPVTERSRMR
jgi:NitT/TauT family transport system substrate-binding protein